MATIIHRGTDFLEMFGHGKAVAEGHDQAGPLSLLRAYGTKDIRDTHAVSKVIKDYGIKACIHFATFSMVGESTQNPIKYFDNNVAAGLPFLSTLVEGRVEAIVFSSTAAAYCVPQISPIPETHPLVPTRSHANRPCIGRATQVRYGTPSCGTSMPPELILMVKSARAMCRKRICFL